MNKKALYFLGGILLLIVITVGFIFYVKSTQNSNTQLISNTNPTPVTPIAPAPTPAPTPQTPAPAPASSTPTAFIQDQVISPALSYDGKLVWYFSSSGHLYYASLSSGAKQEYLLPSNIVASKIIWPTTGSDFIVQTDNGTTRTFSYYNSQTKSFIKYPANISSVDFLADGLHVVYTWKESNGSLSLTTANSDLSNHKTIVSLPDKGIVIKASPAGNKIFGWKDGVAADGKLYYINLDNPKVIAIKTAGNNQAVWSSDGQKFAFVKLGPEKDPSSTKIWLGDLVSVVDQPLNLTTSMSKIVFDSTGRYMYVAVPGDNNKGDAFWKINTQTLDKKQISANSAGIDASSLMISSDGSTLYFKNNKDGYIYQLGTGN